MSKIDIIHVHHKQFMIEDIFMVVRDNEPCAPLSGQMPKRNVDPQNFQQTHRGEPPLQF